jgi:hypothetical protein
MPDTNQAQPPAPTPDNTPLPGGGSWRWSTERAGWVPSDIADIADIAEIADAAPAAAKPFRFQE